MLINFKVIYKDVLNVQDGDTNAGQLPENIGKNRYRDVLPYEVCTCDGYYLACHLHSSISNVVCRTLEYGSTQLTMPLAMTMSMQVMSM